jgi:hypothetical protein
VILGSSGSFEALEKNPVDFLLGFFVCGDGTNEISPVAGCLLAAESIELDLLTIDCFDDGGFRSD